MTDHTSTMAGGDDGDDESLEPGLVLSFAANVDDSPRGFALTARSHTIGREPGPGGFVLTQPAVSRMHAVVHRDRERVRIKDLGSRNGTWVNGARVEECELAPGDDVRIGDAVFVYVERDANAHLKYRLDGTRAPDAPAVTIPDVVGGFAMARLSAEVTFAARSGAAVLVRGETGVGKELVARGCHAAFERRGPFVAVNCAALPAHLLESELFGHVKGAFSGALRDHEGLVRSADGGTLFLDEVGDLALEAQAKLLRMLETREVMPVGATRPKPVDVRIVCATHQDLPAMMAAQRFRADLYARIAGATVSVPSLRAHKEDLLFLVRHALARASAAHLVPTFPFMARLVRYDWPLNVRELYNVVQHAAALAVQGELRVGHLPKDFGMAAPPPSVLPHAPVPSNAPTQPPPRRKAPDEDTLRKLLTAHAGNVSAVARAIDADPTQIYRWLRRYDLDPDSFR